MLPHAIIASIMNDKERKVYRRKKGATSRNPEDKSVIPEGAYEPALPILKRALLEETSGVGDSDFWQPIEERPR